MDLKRYASYVEKSQRLKEKYAKNFPPVLAGYLVNLYEDAQKDPRCFTELKQECENEAHRSNIAYIINALKNTFSAYISCRQYPEDYFIGDLENVENYPASLIKLLQYLCELHERRLKNSKSKCWSFFKERRLGDRQTTAYCLAVCFGIFKYICQKYEENGYQYNEDEELRACIFRSADSPDFPALFERIMEKRLPVQAKNYTSFYSTLLELAQRKGYSERELKLLYKNNGMENYFYNHSKIDTAISKKDTAALILMLKLDYREASLLLKAAGFQFNGFADCDLLKSLIVSKSWSRDLYTAYLDKYYKRFCSFINNGHRTALNLKRVEKAAKEQGYKDLDALDVLYYDLFEVSGSRAIAQLEGLCCHKDKKNLYRLLKLEDFFQKDFDISGFCERAALICFLNKSESHLSPRSSAELLSQNIEAFFSEEDNGKGPGQKESRTVPGFIKHVREYYSKSNFQEPILRLLNLNKAQRPSKAALQQRLSRYAKAQGYSDDSQRRFDKNASEQLCFRLFGASSREVLERHTGVIKSGAAQKTAPQARKRRPISFTDREAYKVCEALFKLTLKNLKLYAGEILKQLLIITLNTRDDRAVSKAASDRISSYILQEHKNNRYTVNEIKELIKFTYLIDLKRLLEPKQSEELEQKTDSAELLNAAERLLNKADGRAGAAAEILRSPVCSKRILSGLKIKIQIIGAPVSSQRELLNKILTVTDGAHIGGIYKKIFKTDKCLAEHTEKFYGLTGLPFQLFLLADWKSLTESSYKSFLKLAEKQGFKGQSCMEQLYWEIFSDKAEEILHNHQALNCNPDEIEKVKAKLQQTDDALTTNLSSYYHRQT